MPGCAGELDVECYVKVVPKEYCMEDVRMLVRDVDRRETVEDLDPKVGTTAEGGNLWPWQPGVYK